MDKIRSYIHRATGKVALAVRVSWENYGQLLDFMPMTDDVTVTGCRSPNPLTIIVNKDPASRKADVISDGDYVFRYISDEDVTLKNLHSLDSHLFAAAFMPAAVSVETPTANLAEEKTDAAISRNDEVCAALIFANSELTAISAAVSLLRDYLRPIADVGKCRRTAEMIQRAVDSLHVDLKKLQRDTAPALIETIKDKAKSQ